MAAFLSALTPALREFIGKQHLFFTASAPSGAGGGGGRINLSPKGIDTFRVLSDTEVAYLDLTGSGNETAAHLRDNGRLTIMFCAFADKPLILRLYGRGESIQPHDDRWRELISHFEPRPGTRQIIRMTIDSLQTSCGFGVPLHEFKGQRDQLLQWAEKKGEDGLRDYWDKKNRVSIDGLETGF